MLVSINWIKEFANIPLLPADDLANNFTMSTAEVEKVIVKSSIPQEIKVAEIVSLKPHPEADRLNLVTFKINQNETKEVVCGARNVRIGLKVPYAPLGVTLPNGMLLESKKIRGILSEGMLCSASELGLENSSDGLLELPDSSKVGESLKKTLQIVDEEDVIIEIDNKSLTHRPDLWGHRGLAREFAAYYGNLLKDPYDHSYLTNIKNKIKNSEKSPVKLEVEKSCCNQVFYGFSIKNIKVTESPKWLKSKLESVGIRSINSIVDISNYVMIELGIPLHIYDGDKIKNGQLKIHLADQSEEMTTLDGVSRNLINTDTIISDSEKILVLAGIMGGENSVVDEKTTNIFIEVANWDAAKIRTTSTRLGLRTDSSARYEKSLDSNQCELTLLRTIDLIFKENPSAKPMGEIQFAENVKMLQPLKLEASFSQIKKILGTEISNEKINSIFHLLDFKTQIQNDVIKLEIPTYRITKDIAQFEDLVEEIGRMIGYDNIIPKSPQLEVKPISIRPEILIKRKLRDFLTLHATSLEVFTYPMIGQNILEKISWPVMNQGLVLINSLSIDHDRMRPTLIPTILESLNSNVKNYSTFNLFEIGRVYLEDAKNFKREQNHLMMVKYDSKENKFLNLFDEVEATLKYLQLPYEFSTPNDKFENSVMPRNWKYRHPFEEIDIKVFGKFVGSVFSIHPLLIKNLKLKGQISCAIIDLSAFEENALSDKNKYLPLSKYPAASFDCSVITSKDKNIVDVMSVFKKNKPKEISDFKILSIYPYNEIENSITFRFKFMGNNKTLEPQEIKGLEELVIATFEKNGFPLKLK